MYFFIGLHCLLPEAITRVEVFCKKDVFKNFVNFTGKHLCWRIRLQAWHLFWRTPASDCFCTALASLTVTYSFYLIISTFFIITATIANISNVCFGSNPKGFTEFKSGISFSLKSLSLCCFLFQGFFERLFLFFCFFHFFGFFTFSCHCSEKGFF